MGMMVGAGLDLSNSTTLMEIVDNKVMVFMPWSHGCRSWGRVVLGQFVFFISYSRFSGFSSGTLADIQRAGPRRCT